jgi:hypothetical protein
LFSLLLVKVIQADSRLLVVGNARFPLRELLRGGSLVGSANYLTRDVARDRLGLEILVSRKHEWPIGTEPARSSWQLYRLFVESLKPIERAAGSFAASVAV